MKDELRDYKVGYAKPPEESRFKKGRSGNPKGRPKGSRNIATTFNQIAREEITVKKNGRTVTMPRYQAVLHQLMNLALSGDAAMMKLVIQLSQMFEETENQAAVASAPQERDAAVFATVLKRMQRFANQSQARGESA